MTTHIIKAAEAARVFAVLLDKVRYKKQSFAIQKGKEVVAKIVPSDAEYSFSITQLNNLFKELPALGKEELLSFAKDVKRARTEIASPENPWD
jgi:c-di-GMP-binding flagellar brake protein YcgR